MSDEKFLGKSFWCIPRKQFVLLIAAWTFLSAFVEAIYLVFIQWMLEGRSLTPQHCHGHVCTQVATCVGSASGTYDFHSAVSIIGGIFIGYIGLAGALNGDPSRLQLFGNFLLFKLALIATFGVVDTGYYFLCDAYPYNVIADSVLFPYPNWPMPEKQKLQITQAPRWFPTGFMHDAAHEDTIWLLYYAVIAIEIFLLGYTAHHANYLAEHCAFGVFGLGANYEVRSWRDRKIFKDKVNDWIDAAKQDIRTTFREDVPIYQSTA